MKPRMIDLFAGCGGLSHGFQQAGFEVVGFVDRAYFWKYDEDSNLIFRAHDEDGDGKPEIAWWWSYYGNGELKSEAIDNDGDGMPDVIKGWVCSPDGEDCIEFLDEDAGGTPDRIRKNEGDWVDMR